MRASFFIPKDLEAAFEKRSRNYKKMLRKKLRKHSAFKGKPYDAFFDWDDLEIQHKAAADVRSQLPLEAPVVQNERKHKVCFSPSQIRDLFWRQLKLRLGRKQKQRELRKAHKNESKAECKNEFLAEEGFEAGNQGVPLWSFARLRGGGDEDVQIVAAEPT